MFDMRLSRVSATPPHPEKGAVQQAGRGVRMKILSLGWGVQSFTLAAMVALGELEPIDYAIHADTTHESKLTYEFAARWTGWLNEHGVLVVTLKNEKANEIVDRWGGVKIPVYSVTPKGNSQIHRQCTGDWKITPIRRWLHRKSKPVEQWIGISLDEFQRMKDSDVKYITNRWPLIEIKMTRNDCVNWLLKHELEVPPKSACTFCPYRSTAEWRRIKQTPEDWTEAVEVDKAIRKVIPPYDLFVHPSRKPLEEVDLRTQEEKGQMSLWDQECSGICGV
jgi:hypothetical protein